MLAAAGDQLIRPWSMDGGSGGFAASAAADGWGSNGPGFAQTDGSGWRLVSSLLLEEQFLSTYT